MTPSRGRVRAALPLALALLAAAARAGSAAAALPVSITVGDCTIQAPASLEPQAVALARQARGILPRLERRLGVSARAPYRVFLVPPRGAPDPEMAVLEARAPRWAAGYMVPEVRTGAVRVALSNRYPYGSIESVFAHEVAHLLLHDAAEGAMPRWFNEGVATQEGRRWSLEDAFHYTSSLLTSSLPRFAAMDREFEGPEPRVRLAYAASFAFVSWAERTYGPQTVREIIGHLPERSFEDAWHLTTGVTLEESENTWRGRSLLQFRWVPILTAGTTLWAVIALLAFVGGLRKRAAQKRVRQEWEQREREEDHGVV